MSYLLKIFLSILHTRMLKRLEELNGETQFGFKNCMGSREALFYLITPMQIFLVQFKEVFLCYIDYEKVFDTVKYDTLMTYSYNANIDQSDLMIIENLYRNQEAKVQIT